MVCVLCIGVSTPVAQSRIQECLSQLSEADYNCIMREYKVQCPLHVHVYNIHACLY